MTLTIPIRGLTISLKDRQIANAHNPKKMGKCCSKRGSGICNSSSTDLRSMFHFLTLAVTSCLGAELVSELQEDFWVQCRACGALV